MKLFLLSFLFLFNCYAENWQRHSVLKAGGVEGFSLEKECLRYGEKCYNIQDKASSVFSEVDVQVDDHTKPNYSKNQTQECLNISDCDVKFLALECEDEEESKIKNYNLLEVYCSKFLSYEKKLEKQMALDQTKLAQFNTAKALKDAENLMQKQLETVRAKRECGEKVIDLMILRNATKSLNPGQRKQVLVSYAGVKGLLEVANFSQAKTEIQASAVDGLLVTEADKTSLISFIEKCEAL